MYKHLCTLSHPPSSCTSCLSNWGSQGHVSVQVSTDLKQWTHNPAQGFLDPAVVLISSLKQKDICSIPSLLRARCPGKDRRLVSNPEAYITGDTTLSNFFVGNLCPACWLMNYYSRCNAVQQQPWNEIIPCGWDKSSAHYQRETKPWQCLVNKLQWHCLTLQFSNCSRKSTAFPVTSNSWQ